MYQEITFCSKQQETSSGNVRVQIDSSDRLGSVLLYHYVNRSPRNGCNTSDVQWRAYSMGLAVGNMYACCTSAWLMAAYKRWHCNSLLNNAGQCAIVHCFTEASSFFWLSPVILYVAAAQTHCIGYVGWGDGRWRHYFYHIYGRVATTLCCRYNV